MTIIINPNTNITETPMPASMKRPADAWWKSRFWFSSDCTPNAAEAAERHTVSHDRSLGEDSPCAAAAASLS